MNKVQVLKAIISSRRSIFPKDYTGNKISDEVISEILQAADFAPNHKKTKPWLLKPFSGDQINSLASALATVYRETTPPHAFLEKKYIDISNKIEKAHTVIAVCISFSGLVPEWEEIAATAMAVQNMYLMCNANDLGCYWSTPPMKDHMADFLGLQDHQKCYGFFYIGSLS